MPDQRNLGTRNRLGVKLLARYSRALALVLVPISVGAQDAPTIDVDPVSLSTSLPQGQEETQILSISNLGTATLEWTVTEAPDAGGAAGTVSASSLRPVGVGTPPGVDARAEALKVWDDGTGPALYVGGRFSLADGAPINRIARWDGSGWSALGSGLNGNVFALAVFDGALIAGGAFTEAGGVPVSNIARWDGSEWSALGSGVNGEVDALTVLDGQLVAGGQFTSAGGVSANRVAQWDGSNWSPLGTGMNSTVRALIVFDDDLIAGGQFATAGGVTVNRIAQWDGSSWSPLGTGMTGTVFDLTEFGGALIATGAFLQAGGVPDTSLIASWDGSAWSPLGTGLSGGFSSTALTVFGGELIAGGVFLDAGGTTVNRIARWNGSEWFALGTGIITQVAVLAVFDDALIAGGFLTEAGGVLVSNIARWDGSEWSPLVSVDSVDCVLPSWVSADPLNGTVPGGGAQTVEVTFNADGVSIGDYEASLCLASNDPAQPLTVVPLALTVTEAPPAIDVTPASLSADLAPGQMETQPLSISNLGAGALEWAVTEDPEAVSASSSAPGAFGTPPGVDARSETLEVWDDGGGPALHVGGRFGMAGDVPASRIARWDGGGWSALGSGLNGNVFALAVYDGALIAAGTFTEAGGVPASNIARWDGSAWSALGSGVNGQVNALTLFDGKLIVGGAFTQAGGASISRVAQWDGSAWSPLGAGTNNTVFALAAFDEALIVSGSFTQAGGAAANRIARWDGTGWAPLGSGLNTPALALAVFGDALIAGGNFTEAGGNPVGRVARWDGNEWSPLATGVNSQVGALAVHGGELVAGGSFTLAGGTSASRVARWNGSEWMPLGDGVLGQVAALAELDGTLFVGGFLSEAGGIPVSNIASWDGSAWAPLEPGACLLPDWMEIVPASGTVPGGDTQVVDVVFDATGVDIGHHVANLCLASNDPVRPLTVVPLELTVLAQPSLAVAPELVDFGAVEVDETAGPLAVTLSSVGTAAVEVTAVPAATDPFASAGGDCPAAPFDLELGASCTLSYTFTPTTAGSFEQTVEIESNAAPVDFVLTGAGVLESSPPEIEVTPDTLSVELDPDQSASETLAIANLGTETLDWEIESVPSLLTDGVVLGADVLTDRVMAFDAESGDLIDADFIPADPQSGLDWPVHVILNAGQDGFLVSDQTGHVVHAYDLNGTWSGVFAPPGGPDTSIAENIRGIRISPEGTLLVSVGQGNNAHAIAEFDADGIYVGNFVDNQAGGLTSPYDILLRTSDILISSLDSWIYRYDYDGSPLPLFSDEIPSPWQLAELDDGHVLAASHLAGPGGVWEMDAEGNQVAVYSGITGNRGVYRLANGNILTSNLSGVHEIDLNGNLLETKAPGRVFSLSFVQISTQCTSPSWLQVTPQAGSVSGNESVEVTVMFDSAGLAPGEHQASICIASNDPVESLVVVPVSLIVRGENPLPVLDDLDPDSVLAGTGGFTLTAFGSDFAANAVLRWAGADRSTTFISSGELTAEILASDVEETGFFPVTVFNPAPGGGESDPLDFEVLVNAPAIQATPASLAARLWFDLSIDLTLTLGNVGTQTLIWNFVLDDIGGGCELPSWLTISGAFGGQMGPGGSTEATVTLSASGLEDGDYEASICVESNDPAEPLLLVPVELTVGVPEDFAVIEGTTTGLGYCNEAPSPLQDAQILIAGQMEQYAVGSDEDGFYRIAVDAVEGPVQVEASASEHVPETVEDVILSAGETVTLDFDLSLDAPCAAVEPEAFDFELSDGASESRTMTIGNARGGGSLMWDLVDTVGTVGSVGTSGGVIWHQPLDHPGGAGFFFGVRSIVFLNLPNHPVEDPGVYTADDFLIESDQAIGEIRSPGFWGPCGSPGFDAEYKARSISWYIYPDAGGAPAGHPEDGESRHVWTFSGAREPTGGNPPVWDPAVSFGEVCPGPGGTFCREEIQLDVVVADGGALQLEAGRYWLVVVPHSAPVQVCAPGTDPLWNVWAWHRGVPAGLRAHHIDPHDLYDTGATSWTPLPAGGAAPGHTDQAFTLLSGPAGQCWDPDEVDWLTVEPTEGEIPGGESFELTVTADSSGLAPGDYLVRICVNTNDPERPQISVPVDLTVGLPASFGAVEGNVRSQGHCGTEQAPIAGAEVVVESQAEEYTLFADEDGFYELALDAAEGPVDITASAPGHLPQSASGIELVAGETAMQDFDLILEQPCATVEPAAFTAELPKGSEATFDLMVGNVDGGAALDWTIDTAASLATTDSRDLIGKAGDVISTWRASAATPGVASFALGSGGLPSEAGELVVLGDLQMTQTADTNIVPAHSVACPTGPNHLLRRFYFAEHAGVGNPAQISSVDIAVAQGVASQTLTVNLYTLPSSTAVDTIPVGALSPIGSASVTISPANDGAIVQVPVVATVSDTAALDLVVEATVAAHFFIGATNTGETHPGFIMAPACGGAMPTRIDSLGPDFENINIIMVINAGEASACDSPKEIPWLSVAPDSGITDAGETNLATVMIDASALGAGEYEALLCLSSNDSDSPLVEIPVTLNVTEAGVAELTFDPASLDFGDVEVGTTSPPQAAMLHNTGDLDLTGLSFGGLDDSFDADTSGCGAILPVGASCEVVVTFSPPVPGPSSATLTADSAEGATAELELAGNGVDESQVFSPVVLAVDFDALLSDGNGVFEPGERVEVAPAWRHDGIVAQLLAGVASDFTGPEGPTYTLVVDDADYGELEPGETASCQETGMCYQMDVGPAGVGRPAMHWEATFDEALSDDTVKTWTLHIGDSFADVARSSTFYSFIETLLHNGVTGGCTGTEYCPTAHNTRAQMPVFVLRALEGADYVPPACEEGSEVFGDVPFSHSFCAWIEELANRGVVAGCGGGNYCPNAPVTRGQMTVFLLRTLEGSGYTPPACSGLFVDVPCPSTFAGWIEELYNREITGGCGTAPLRYCPARPVNRQQMAAFVTRTFGLTLYGP